MISNFTSFIKLKIKIVNIVINNIMISNQHFSLTVVHNFRVLVGFKESGVVPKNPARAVPAATAWIELFFDIFPKKSCFDIFLTLESLRTI